MTHSTENVKLISISSRSNNVADLEKNIFERVGVRIVIRIDQSLEIFAHVEREMSAKLSLDDTVATWRNLLLSVLSNSQALGRRGASFTFARSMRAGDIVFLRPDGKAAAGSQKICNIVWSNVNG